MFNQFVNQPTIHIMFYYFIFLNEGKFDMFYKKNINAYVYVFGDCHTLYVQTPRYHKLPCFLQYWASHPASYDNSIQMRHIKATKDMKVPMCGVCVLT